MWCSEEWGDIFTLDCMEKETYVGIKFVNVDCRPCGSM